MPSLLSLLIPMLFFAAASLAVLALVADVRRFGADWLMLLRPSSAPAAQHCGFRDVRVRWFDTGSAIAPAYASAGNANVVLLSPLLPARNRMALAAMQADQLALAA